MAAHFASSTVLALLIGHCFFFFSWKSSSLYIWTLLSKQGLHQGSHFYRRCFCISHQLDLWGSLHNPRDPCHTSSIIVGKFSKNQGFFTVIKTFFSPFSALCVKQVVKYKTIVSWANVDWLKVSLPARSTILFQFAIMHTSKLYP